MLLIKASQKRLCPPPQVLLEGNSIKFKTEATPPPHSIKAQEKNYAVLNTLTLQLAQKDRDLQ